MGTRGPKPKRKTNPKWSAELAYGVGLFATDGCLYNDERHLSFVSQDLELLKLFKKCLKIDTRITYKAPSKTGKRCPHLQWGDVMLYNFFQSIGIHPRKSLTIGRVLVPDAYFFDFLRGLIDGDGSFYSYYDPRWRSSFMYYLVLASGSESFLKWVRAELALRLGVRGHMTRSKKKKTTMQLKYAKTESFKIIQKMYYSARVPSLTRKRIKIFKALREAGDLTN